MIAHISQPKGRTQEGLGRPGALPPSVAHGVPPVAVAYGSLHHRNQSRERPFPERNPLDHPRPPYALSPFLPSSLTPPTGSVLAPFLPPSPLSPRAAPLSPLAPLLSLTPSPLPEALAPLAELYEHLLVRAKYGKEEPSEEDWDNVVKIVAVFVGVLGAGGGGARA